MISDKPTKLNITLYLHQIRRQLLIAYSETESEELLQYIHEQINLFLLDNPSASMHNVEEYVVNLGDFTLSKLENNPSASIEKIIKQAQTVRKRAHLIILVTLFCLITLFSYFACDLFINRYYNTGSYVLENIQY